MLLRLAVLGAAIAVSHALELEATTQMPEANCSAAPPCDYTTCVLPDCQCSGEETAVADYSTRPQIIYLTFDDAFTAFAEENFFRGLFNGTFTNPNGCPIRATHFLTAQYNDFVLVNQYWKLGHEFGSHSISHRTNLDYWRGLNVDGWNDEAEGMRRMISQFSAIPKEDIKGHRAPFLQMGGDEMYTSLYETGFKFDCSWVTREFGYLNLDMGLFPYTMDYGTVQDCQIEPCAECSYPGFWVQPMLDLEDAWFGADPNHPDNGMPCSMLDGCIIIEDDPDRNSVKDMLMRNFLRNRNGTRAPMGLFAHAAWFYGDNLFHYEGYLDFIQEVTTNYDDVWFVTVSEGIDYVANYNDMTNAQLLNMTNTEGPFGCAPKTGGDCAALDPCRYEEVVNDDIHGEERYMHICGKDADGHRQKCPPEYPWLGNPCGGNTPCT